MKSSSSFSLCLIFVPLKHYITLRLENRLADQTDQINLDKLCSTKTIQKENPGVVLDILVQDR